MATSTKPLLRACRDLTVEAMASTYSIGGFARMSEHRIELLTHGIFASGVVRNPASAILYEDAIRSSDGELASSGAIIARSGAKTGRSPKDKRLVKTAGDPGIWWGSVNIPLSE